MCLILLAWKVDLRFPLVVAANRDEFHARPTQGAHEWEDGIIAGRDLESGGTWLGITRNGRFAAVTNYHEQRPKDPGDRSRGELVAGFLRDFRGPREYLEAIDGRLYAGFGLLVSDLRELGYYSNRADGVRMLEPGIYGLSNHLLDSDWVKVRRGKEAMRRILPAPGNVAEGLFAVLADRTGLPDRQAAAFVVDPIHGTRSSTVAILSTEKPPFFEERTFQPDGRPAQPPNQLS